MPAVRRIQGELVFPNDAPATTAARAVLELRDVSVMDQPSRVVADTTLRNLPVGPGARVPFEFEAPEASPADALALRAVVFVEANVDGGSAAGGGDYLSTASHTVQPTGDVNGLRVPLARP